MKNRTVLLLGSLFVVSLAAVACGGAIDTPGGGSSSSSSSSSSGGPGPTPTATTTSTVTPPPIPPSPPTPIGPAPFFGTWSGTASGCANFTVFAPDTSNPRYLVINASKSELGLGVLGSTATVDLANTSQAPSTDVGVDTFASAPAQPYCTDIQPSPAPTSFHSKALQGSVTFSVTAVGRDGGYVLTVARKNVIVRAPDGGFESIPDITYTNVSVGWLPG